MIFMKKTVCVILVSIFTLAVLAGCNNEEGAGEETTAPLEFEAVDVFESVISPDGVEYAYFAHEQGGACAFGEFVFLGGIKDEESPPLGVLSVKMGMYSLEGDTDQRILMRMMPNSEWASYYRKTSLPALNVMPENCSRLEFSDRREIKYGSINSPDIAHMSCGDGLTGREEINAFFAEVKGGLSPEEAGLKEILKRPDGSYNESYQYGVIYGFFEDEVNFALAFPVTSYNGEAFSVKIGESEYVLSKELLRSTRA